MTRVETSAGGGVAAAVDLLRAGEVVALPTETVYGLGADATQPLACARIFEAKSRPLSDPLIVHVPDLEWARSFGEFDAVTQRLIEVFWPGPLTVVVPRRAGVPDLVTAGQDTVAMRMSAHPVFAEVVTGLGRGIAAPSANRFGRISPTDAPAVMDELGGRIPLILDAGACAHGLESTIVRVVDDQIDVLRAGPVTREMLERVAPVRRMSGGDVVTPGSMKSHYAPRTPLDVVEPEALDGLDDAARVGLILPSPEARAVAGRFGAVEVLSESGDMREMAANLYRVMRMLDAGGWDRIVALAVPTDGIGAAIMERLGKAAARE